MQVTETHSKGLSRGFKVVLPADVIEQRLTIKLKEIGEKVKVPGFRPGKVPLNLLKQRYTSNVMGEVLEEAVTESSTLALSERDLRPAQKPKIEITEFEKDGDLEYTMEIEILPDFEVMDLAKLKLTKKIAEIDAKTLDEALARLAENNKITKTVEAKRKTKSGDVVLLDFDGAVDGERKDGMKGEDHELELGSNSFIPGFEDQLIGVKAGDDVEVKVTFPEEYHAPDLAGKEAVFACKVKEIRAYEVPAIDEGLAKKMGLDTLEDLKNIVTEHLQRDFEQLSRDLLKRDILDALAEAHDFEVPDGMIEAEFKEIWRNVQHAMEHNHLPEEDQGKSEDELKSEYRAIAARRVRLGLLFSEIGNAAKVDVAPEKVQRALFEEVRKYPGHEKEVFEYFQNNPDAMSQIKAPLYEDGVVDHIISQASITEVTVSLDDLRNEPTETAKPKAKAKKKAPAKKAAAKKETAAKKTPAKKAAAKKASSKSKAKAEG